MKNLFNCAVTTAATTMTASATVAVSISVAAGMIIPSSVVAHMIIYLSAGMTCMMMRCLRRF